MMVQRYVELDFEYELTDSANNSTSHASKSPTKSEMQHENRKRLEDWKGSCPKIA